MSPLYGGIRILLVVIKTLLLSRWSKVNQPFFFRNKSVCFEIFHTISCWWFSSTLKRKRFCYSPLKLSEFSELVTFDRGFIQFLLCIGIDYKCHKWYISARAESASCEHFSKVWRWNHWFFSNLDLGVFTWLFWLLLFTEVFVEPPRLHRVY